MNDGVVGETGQTVRSFFDSMKDQPLALALVVVVVLLIGYIYYQGIATTNARRANVEAIITWQKDVQILLSRCVVPRTSVPELLPNGADPPKPGRSEAEPLKPNQDPT